MSDTKAVMPQTEEEIIVHFTSALAFATRYK